MDAREQVRPKRVFVSNVDTYSSKCIAKFLSTCTPGELSEDDGGEAAEKPPVSPGEDRTSDDDQGTFQIVGTVSSVCEESHSFLGEQYLLSEREQLLERLVECDAVVYNISEHATEEHIEEATWAVTALHAEMDRFRSQKIFILVSTVMTWAMTKPRDQDDVLTDDDYRRRRPHPNFKNHYNLEKLVLKLGKAKRSKLAGYVVAGGLQYGRGENLFHYFFKTFWSMQIPKVPVFGSGTDYLPMIHVYDLGGVIQNVIDLRPKSQYVLAVDDSKNTLEDAMKVLSAVLGPGKINKVSEAEARSMKDLKEDELEYLSINLNLEAVILKSSFNFPWKYEAGMVENINHIVKEYKDSRQLLPIRIFLSGPPAVGKTTVAEKLCKYYQVHHIKLKEVIEERITELEETVKGGDVESDNEESVTVAQDELQSIRDSMAMNGGRLADPLVFHILQDKLNSAPCRNQGFILDGFPKTYEQAKAIFSDEDTESEDYNPKIPMYNKRITPEFVFSLEASDNFLMERARGLPQILAEEMRYTQVEFVARLAKYRRVGVADETALDYFDEMEIHPDHIEVNTVDLEYTDVMKKITEVVGRPRNYGSGPQEQEAERQRLEEERQQRQTLEAARKKKQDGAALAQLAAQYEEWERNVSEVKRQEQELLEAQSIPLRNYLMKYVMPSLSEAMVECCKVKPDDPVDFLAEHLLQNNSQD